MQKDFFFIINLLHYRHIFHFFDNIMNSEDKQHLKQVYKSSIRASYFHYKEDPVKSKIFQKAIQEEDQNVDQNTFRIQRGFKRPDNPYEVYKKTGKFYTESLGFFGCFGRKSYHVQLINRTLYVHFTQKIYCYLDFDTVSATVSKYNDYFTIQILGNNKKFQFYPEPKTEVADWVQLLTKIIGQSDGKKKSFSYLAKTVQQFYLKFAITNQQFHNVANTGDILLFRSEHGAAKVQQFITNSEYDHVALVLRNKKNEIYMFESSSFEGVGLTPWKNMVRYGWYQSVEKIAWRKLNITLSNADVDVIEAFIAKTLGKGFQITFGKLFTFQSKLTRTKQQEQSKTYFCSQLVARVYKQLRLLPENVACTTYYPVNFSDAGNLKFIKEDVKFGREYLISFEK